MLILIHGRIGNGKTLLLVYFATKLKRLIYSNFKLDLPNFRPFILSKLSELPENINIFLDEGYILSESRRSSSNLNLIMTYIYNQSRKSKRDIYITSQLYSAIDKRFRLQANLVIDCDKINGNFFYTITNRETGQTTIKCIPKEFTQKFFKLYDTYEIIKPINDIDLDFELIKQDPEELLIKAEIYGNLIDNELENIYHEEVRQELFFRKISVKFEPYVYLYLKKKRRSEKVIIELMEKGTTSEFDFSIKS